ncbi:hypothetical protein AB0E08_49575 [Streptomyces sp. NPDC048281]|uniref:hypothetical protein n=1 Tax=Streptomyces sp. NPDC048281 TaxID=3154715 RepID=UPI0034478A6F
MNEDLDDLAVQLEHLARQGGWLDRPAYLQGTHRYTYGETTDGYDEPRAPCGSWASTAETACS